MLHNIARQNNTNKADLSFFNLTTKVVSFNFNTNSYRDTDH